MIVFKGTYQAKIRTCSTSDGTFGSACSTQSDCQSGLICTTSGVLTGFCVNDVNGACASDYDCANLMSCNPADSKCGCSSSCKYLILLIFFMKLRIIFFKFQQWIKLQITIQHHIHVI